MNYVLCPGVLRNGPAGKLLEELSSRLVSYEMTVGNEKYVLLVDGGPAGDVIDLTVHVGSLTVVVGQFVSEEPAHNMDMERWINTVRGNFALFSQKDPKTVQFLNDHVSSATPYCVESCAGLVVASRLDWAVRLAGIPLTWNYGQMHSFVFGGMQVGDGTFFHEVSVIPAGSKVILTAPARMRTERWWQETFQPCGRASTIEHLAGTLVGAARTWLQKWPRSICGLTGGFDSRLTLSAFSIAARDLGYRLNTVTAGGAHAHDVYLARELAGIADSDHLELDYSDVEDIQETMWQLENSQCPLWLLASGQARHSFIYMYWLNQRLREAGFDAEVNSLGGEIIKGMYHKHTGHGLRAAVTNVLNGYVSRALNADIFRGKGKKALQGAADYFTQEGLKDIPSGTGLLQQVDWFCLKNRFTRGWSPRFHFCHQIGSVYFPLLDREFIECGANFPASERSEGKLTMGVIKSLRPDLARVPISSGCYPERFTPSLRWRIRASVAARLLKRPILQPSDFRSLRPLILDRWRSALRLMSQVLPSLSTMADRLTSERVLVGGSVDFRLYYVTRFIADLVEAYGVEIREA